MERSGSPLVSQSLFERKSQFKLSFVMVTQLKKTLVLEWPQLNFLYLLNYFFFFLIGDIFVMYCPASANFFVKRWNNVSAEASTEKPLNCFCLGKPELLT